MDNKNGIQVGSLQKSLADDLRLDHQNLNDRDLYNLCQKYGSNARMWKRKFASLLPEVEKRGLYKKYNFYSIYEFAAKLGGVANRTVDEVLRTYKKVEEKPLLKKQIEKVGWGKVRAVSSLINKVKEENLVEMIDNLPKQALEEAVRQIKKQREDEIFNGNDTTKQDAMQIPPGWNLTGGCNNGVEVDGSDSSRVKETKFTTMSFKVDNDTEFRLRKFQQKLQKEKKEPVSFNNVLKELLNVVEKSGAREVKMIERKSKRKKQKNKKPQTSATTKQTSKRNEPKIKKSKDSFAIEVGDKSNNKIDARKNITPTVPRYVNVKSNEHFTINTTANVHL